MGLKGLLLLHGVETRKKGGGCVIDNRTLVLCQLRRFKYLLVAAEEEEEEEEAMAMVAALVAAEC